MLFTRDFILVSRNLKTSSKSRRLTSSLGKFKIKYKDPADGQFKFTEISALSRSDATQKFEAQGPGFDVVGVDELVAPTQQSPTSSRGTFEVLVEEKKTGKKTRYKITGPSQEAVVKKLDYSGFKVLDIKPFSNNSVKSPGKQPEKTSTGKHYSIYMQDKNGNFFNATGWGDKDKLKKKVENSGYSVINMKDLTLSPQSKNYNIFRDTQVVNLLYKKGVSKEQITQLAKENMRGVSPHADDSSWTEEGGEVTSHRIINGGYLTPYYIRFSSN